jgi:hypothetical protein
VVAISELLAFYVLKLDWFRHAALLQEICLGEEFSGGRLAAEFWSLWGHMQLEFIAKHWLP